MNVYLSVYILDDEDGANSLLPFLCAAESEDAAVDLSDAFVTAIETIATPDTPKDEHDEATLAIDDLRPVVSLLESEEEIRLVAATIKRHNPAFEEEIVGCAGSLLTMEVNAEAGFDKETIRILRNHMACHTVVSSLSVELV